jgi:hypothetical protein
MIHSKIGTLEGTKQLLTQLDAFTFLFLDNFCRLTVFFRRVNGKVPVFRMGTLFLYSMYTLVPFLWEQGAQRPWQV